MVKKCMSAMPMAILPMRKDQPNRRLKKKLTFTPVLTTKRLLIGFSSSINASKANTTLHAFQFTNDYKPIDEEASYRINYWKFNPDTENYEKAESSEVMTGAVGDTVTVAEADPSYATKI